MNVAFFALRLFIGFFLFISSFSLLFGEEKIRSEKGAIAAMILSVFVAFPALWVLLSGNKPEPASALSKQTNGRNVMRWTRTVFAVILGIMGMACFGTQQDAVAYPTLLISLALLSPLNQIIFGRNEPKASGNADSIILALRNTGFLLYLCGTVLLGTGSYVGGGILLGIAVLLIFIRPIVRHYIPFEAAPVYTPPVQKAPPVVVEEPLIVRQVTPLKFKTVVVEPEPAPEKIIVLSEMEKLKAEYTQLLSLAPHRRGYAFQDFLNHLFRDFSAKSAFRLVGEEIDGSFEIDSQIYLLEAKWQAMPSGQRDLLVFNGKVEGKSTWARGIFISYAGFTKEGLIAFARGKRTSIIGMDGNDISLVLDEKISLTDAIKRKARRAVETNDFFVSLEELL